MAKAKTHKDVEYAVDDAGGKQRIFKTWDEACGFAVSIALTGKEEVYVDVLVYSKAGARFIMDDEGVEQYEEDPDASVFERIAIRVNPQGRVP